MLNSNACGMRYNDSTYIISNISGTKAKYIDGGHKSDNVMAYDLDQMPDKLTKKSKILKYYQNQLKVKKEEH